MPDKPKLQYFVTHLVVAITFGWMVIYHPEE